MDRAAIDRGGLARGRRAGERVAGCSSSPRASGCGLGVAAVVIVMRRVDGGRARRVRSPARTRPSPTTGLAGAAHRRATAAVLARGDRAARRRGARRRHAAGRGRRWSPNADRRRCAPAFRAVVADHRVSGDFVGALERLGIALADPIADRVVATLVHRASRRRSRARPGVADARRRSSARTSPSARRSSRGSRGPWSRHGSRPRRHGWCWCSSRAARRARARTTRSPDSLVLAGRRGGDRRRATG